MIGKNDTAVLIAIKDCPFGMRFYFLDVSLYILFILCQSCPGKMPIHCPNLILQFNRKLISEYFKLNNERIYDIKVCRKYFIQFLIMLSQKRTVYIMQHVHSFQLQNLFIYICHRTEPSANDIRASPATHTGIDYF